MKNNTIGITIIVPFYNNESEIELCIKSLLSQKGVSIQYIFVDDGSIDDSYAVVKRLTDGVDNVEIIRQENQGQSIARNNALKKAVGEYILFVDADDFISENACALLYNQAKSNNLDMLRAHMQRISDGKELPVNTFSEHANVVESGRDRLIKGYVSYSLCENMYRRALLEDHKISFIGDATSFEDMDFVTRATWHAKKMMDINEIFYFYIQNGNSVSNAYSIEKVRDYYIVASKINEFVEEEVDEEAYELYFRDYLGFLYSHVINMCAIQKYKFYSLFNKHDRKKILRNLRKAKQSKYKLQALLVSCGMYKLYGFIYRIKFGD